MSNLPVPAAGTSVQTVEESTQGMFVTMTVAGQLFGIRVLIVQDVLGPQRIARVPLAPPEILGSLNLRGRIVTAIDVRTRLGLPKRAEDEKGMSVVVEHEDELYSLVVDKVGEVMTLPASDYERNPATLDPRWQEIADGVYRLPEALLVVINVARFLRIGQVKAA